MNIDGSCDTTIIENVLKQKYSSPTGDNIVVADIDHRLIHLLKNVGNDPTGFPTMRYIKNDSKTIEDYEDSNDVSNKDRKIDSFVEWIDSKIGQKGGRKTKSTKTRKIMKQKGGLMINANDREAFEEFIKNSTITFKTSGSTGITFVATINNNVSSKYTFMDVNNFGKPVTELLIKLTFLYDPSNNEEKTDVAINPRYEVDNQQWFFDSTTIDDFKREVNIQTDIFLKTMNYLQPVCPAIVYANIYNGENNNNNDTMSMDTLFQILDNNSKQDKFTNNIINEIIRSHKEFDDYSNLGLIGMEIASGYVTMYELKKQATDMDRKKKFIICMFMCYYLLIRLAVETGYSQADYHYSNIMIKPNCTNYFDNIHACPLLIDFGYAVKISPEYQQLVNKYYKEKNYTYILRILCNTPRSDDYNLKQSPKHYGWACGNYNNILNTFDETRVTNNFIPNTDNHIDNLIVQREKAIDNVVSLFDKYHSENPQLYPLLPLSNSAKNKMYSGLIPGGVIKNKKNNYEQPMDETSEGVSHSSLNVERGSESLVDSMANMNISPLTNDSTPDSNDLRQKKKQRTGGKWSRKYKKSINCKRPKGFSQKQYCKYGRSKNKTKRNNKNRK